MNEILCVAFVNCSMQYLHEKGEPIEIQHAQNQPRESHDVADRFVGGKLGRERVELESCIGKPLHHDEPGPKPGQNHQCKCDVAYL